jgi:hypothetical protein
MSNRNGVFRCDSAATAVTKIQCAPNPALPQRPSERSAPVAASLQQIAQALQRSRKKRCQLRKS